MSDASFWVGSDPPYRETMFAQNGPGATQIWQSWIKPRGVQFVYILAIGGGGGGGGGLTGAASAARGGGGGGGNGGIWKLLAPARLLPDKMWISVGKGGAGSTGSGVAGSAGQQSYLAGIPLVATTTMYGTSGNGNGGAAGTGSGNAAGGTSTAANQYQGIGQIGFMVVITAGGSGALGGAATGGAGGNYNLGGTNNGLAGGAGGGGTTSADFAGGDQVAPSVAYTQTVTGGAAGTNNGKAGLWLPTSPFGMHATGGTGGGASNTAAGGAGGPGSYGCGGAGGGGGTTGGAGGAGGDGLVIISAW